MDAGAGMMTITMSRRRKAAPPSPTTPSKPEWRETVDDFTEELTRVEENLRRTVTEISGLRDAQDEIESAIAALIDPSDDSPTSLRRVLEQHAPDALDQVRNALARIRELASHGEDVYHPLEYAIRDLEKLSIDPLVEYASKVEEAEELVDEHLAKIEDLKGDAAELLTPDEVGGRLTDCGWRRPAMDGWTRAAVIEALDEVVWRAHLRGVG